MRWLLILLLLSTAVYFACDDENPMSQGEATDEEAIFNVVMIDNLRLSDMEAFPGTVPDTAAFIANPTAEETLYWHDVDSLRESFQVTISDTPVESPVGLVLEATAVYTKTWFGKFKTWHYNGLADSLERYSKNFQLAGSRSAKCQKWGSTSQRRGWLLTHIGDAHFSAGGGHGFLQSLYYHSESNEDSVFDASLKELDFIPRFDAEEEVTFTFDIRLPTDEAYIFMPVSNFNYELAIPEPAGDGYRVQATMPSISRIYGQLRFYVVNAGVFDEAYRATGYSYNYRIR